MSKDQSTGLERELSELVLTLQDERPSYAELLAAGAAGNVLPMRQDDTPEPAVAPRTRISDSEVSPEDTLKALSVQRPGYPSVAILQEMLAAMELREKTGELPAGYAEKLARAKAHRVELVLLSRALDAVNDAHETQDKRESEEFHLGPEAMRSIWYRAKNRAVTALLALRNAAPAEKKGSSPDIGRQLKARADSLLGALQSFGVSLGHSQVLHAMSRMYGYKGYHALRASLQTSHPAFCPHCGAAGSVTAIRSGRAAQAHEGLVNYRCGSCRNEFAVAVALAEQPPKV